MRKRDDFLRKGTNMGTPYVSGFCRNILPVIIALVLVFSGGFQSTANRILYISSALTFPFESIFLNSYQTPQQDIEEDYAGIVSTGDTVSAASYKISSVPDDIKKLTENAEKQYADSSNDGKILEVDYGAQNATSEYNGIYIRNTTKSQSVDIKSYLQKKVSANINKDEPSVLIYHTHACETYELLDRGFYTNSRSTRSENPQENMIRIGEEICQILTENGYKVIHDKTVYDIQYNGAYERSRENVSKTLKENPSIQIVLDIHRDSIYQKDGTRIKPVCVINGEKTAQIKVISGCEDGNVTDFPNWEKNLAFALALQQKLVVQNPELMRPLLFCGRKYNMDLTTCALQIEIGSDANTLTESVYAARLFAMSLSDLMKDYEV
ncbi:MAG: stage II sporulation protein P [Candidatus Fimenecus sp.]